MKGRKHKKTVESDSQAKKVKDLAADSDDIAADEIPCQNADEKTIDETTGEIEAKEPTEEADGVEENSNETTAAVAEDAVVLVATSPENHRRSVKENSNAAEEEENPASDVITDSQMVKATEVELKDTEKTKKLPESCDGAPTLKGLIRELSALNKMIIDTCKELQTARRQRQGAHGKSII